MLRCVGYFDLSKAVGTRGERGIVALPCSGANVRWSNVDKIRGQRGADAPRPAEAHLTVLVAHRVTGPYCGRMSATGDPRYGASASARALRW